MPTVTTETAVDQSPADSAKPVLVMVPGLGANGDVYRPLLDYLSHHYDVRSAELPSDFPPVLGWDFFFDSIEAAAGTADRFSLVSHSMGGAVALKYAATHPDRVVRTVAVAPVLFPFRRARIGISERFHNAALAIRGGHFRHLFRVLRIIRQQAGEGRARKLYRFLHTIDLGRDLPRITQAAILWPRREEIIPTKQYQRVERDHPELAGGYIKGSHHTIALAPEAVLSAIRSALDG